MRSILAVQFIICYTLLSVKSHTFKLHDDVHASIIPDAIHPEVNKAFKLTCKVLFDPYFVNVSSIDWLQDTTVEAVKWQLDNLIAENGTVQRTIRFDKASNKDTFMYTCSPYQMESQLSWHESQTAWLCDCCRASAIFAAILS